ncbi:uncharacterized protein NFIA_095110 [Aspergillus fischeri NRRL 181]|uniref:Short-chain dehydrogenase n=1 Tax=Neosartorya fischeri (strain ATCC 1020 / DSM 3700 / CBS 544.65 / FGSC A1164 / JCM 1740 / NRRL 181 / WB 181) TaxID=331117 RepID=A1DAK1_NEOFI|nr:uncharacterized protein NFIA_095110 [Aspergillus fischeri NRRL 181]EAW19891.1 hypothetical protein NFIA_095110 [Aspergillus fischeri NRRL 181]KAG2009399.1 hypothetical protein GB937_007802 [Aspergillus fischeri]
MTTPAATTQDGYEVQFGTNHMGYALLTKLLLPVLEQTANAPNSNVRIINLSSSAHNQGPKEGLLLSEVKSPMASTSTWRFFVIPVKDGALNELWTATGPNEDVKQAAFYYPVGVEFHGSPMVNDPKMAEKLWDSTETEPREHGF